MHPSSFLLALALTLWAVPAAAERTLYRCVGPDGVPAYQSSPCPAGAESSTRRVPSEDEARRQDAIDPGAGGAGSAQHERIPQDWGRPAQTTQANTPPAPATAPGPSLRERQCERAKARRKQVRERRWRTLSALERRQLDEDVRDACGR